MVLVTETSENEHLRRYYAERDHFMILYLHLFGFFLWRAAWEITQFTCGVAYKALHNQIVNGNKCGRGGKNG